MERAEAIAVLKEIAADQTLIPEQISLVNGNDGYELHIKSNFVNQASLSRIVEKHGLALKEVSGLLIVHK